MKTRVALCCDALLSYGPEMASLPSQQTPVLRLSGANGVQSRLAVFLQLDRAAVEGWSTGPPPHPSPPHPLRAHLGLPSRELPTPGGM